MWTELVRSVAAVTVPEAVVVGPAVTVTGKNVISLLAKVLDDVPGKLAPVPLTTSVQIAVVVPPMEQITRPELSVIVSAISWTSYRVKTEITYNPIAGSLIVHSIELDAEVYHIPGPMPQSVPSVPGGQLMLYVMEPAPCI